MIQADFRKEIPDAFPGPFLEKSAGGCPCQACYIGNMLQRDLLCEICEEKLNDFFQSLRIHVIRALYIAGRDEFIFLYV